MKTRVSKTSVDAYYRMVDRDGITNGQAAVLAAFNRPGATFTRAELEKATGMRSGSICGRVRELVDDGRLEELPRRTCSVTGDQAHALRIRPAQRKLFDEAA